MTLEEFAERLDKVKMTNSARWGRMVRARCPAHNDKEPSFAVWEGEDGWLHVKCAKGCSEDAIMGALGLKTSDRRIAPVERPSESVVLRVYDYHNYEGEYLFTKEIRGHGAGKKTSQFIRRGKKREYSLASLNRTRDWSKTLYRLPEVVNAVQRGETVYINEGEKGADAVRSLGLVATCQPAGAGPGKWLDQHTSEFMGAKEVVIVADKDAPGEDYAREVYSALRGVADKVTVVNAAVDGEKADAFDHVAKHGSMEGLVRRPDLEGAPALLASRFDPADVLDVRVEFLWEPYLPVGKMVLFDGDGGMGKTSVAASLSAAFTRGLTPWVKADPREPINVLYLHKGEDSSVEIARIFYDNQGDLKRFFLVDDKTLNFDSRGLDRIRTTIIQNDIRLVIADAMFYFIAPIVPKTTEGDACVPILERMTELVRETGVSWLNIRHFTKGKLGKDASDLGMGAPHFRNSHRGQIVMRWHPDKELHPGVLVLTDEKGSLLVQRGEPLAIKREGNRYVLDPSVGGDNPFDQDPRAVGKAPSMFDTARVFLRARLAGGVPVLRSQLVKEAEEIGVSRATLDRAAKELGCNSGDAGGRRYWQILDGVVDTAPYAQQAVLGD